MKQEQLLRDGLVSTSLNPAARTKTGPRWSRSISGLMRTLLANRGYKIIRADASNVLDHLMSSLLKRQGKLSFIQIGANDGIMADPLHPFVTRNHARMTGIVVEPVKDYFRDLERNYRDYPNIHPVNVAIHCTERKMTLYRVSPNAKGLKAWTRGIATFDKNRHADRPYAEHMVPEEVSCVPLEKLFQSHGLPDVLQVDTEGYDEPIIDSLDLTCAPKVIRFEYTAMTEENFCRLMKKFNDHGYQVILEPHDVTAYRSDAFIAERVRKNRSLDS